jgi:hypothetical protein
MKRLRAWSRVERQDASGSAAGRAPPLIYSRSLKRQTGSFSFSLSRVRCRLGGWGTALSCFIRCAMMRSLDCFAAVNQLGPTNDLLRIQNSTLYKFASSRSCSYLRAQQSRSLEISRAYHSDSHLQTSHYQFRLKEVISHFHARVRNSSGSGPSIVSAL